MLLAISSRSISCLSQTIASLVARSSNEGAGLSCKLPAARSLGKGGSVACWGAESVVRPAAPASCQQSPVPIKRAGDWLQRSAYAEAAVVIVNVARGACTCVGSPIGGRGFEVSKDWTRRGETGGAASMGVRSREGICYYCCCIKRSIARTL